MEDREGEAAEAAAMAPKKKPGATGQKKRLKYTKIEEKNKLQTTYSKRHRGIQTKVDALSALTGAEIAFVIVSPGGKPHAFSTPNTTPDAVFDRFLSSSAARESDDVTMAAETEAVGRFLDRGLNTCTPASWDLLEMPIDGMSLEELEGLKAALEDQLGQIMLSGACSSSSTRSPNNCDPGCIIRDGFIPSCGGAFEAQSKSTEGMEESDAVSSDGYDEVMKLLREMEDDRQLDDIMIGFDFVQHENGQMDCRLAPDDFK